MENIVNIANNFVLYTAAYTFLFVIYGITFYALIKGIVKSSLLLTDSSRKTGRHGTRIKRTTSKPKQAAGIRSLPLVLLKGLIL